MGRMNDFGVCSYVYKIGRGVKVIWVTGVEWPVHSEWRVDWLVVSCWEVVSKKSLKVKKEVSRVGREEKNSFCSLAVLCVDVKDTSESHNRHASYYIVIP